MFTVYHQLMHCIVYSEWQLETLDYNK